jgi:hypothetical protein
MSPKSIRLILSFFVAAIVFYFKGPLLAILSVTALLNIFAYLFPGRGAKASDNGKVLAVSLLSLGLFLAAEFLTDTRPLRLSLISAGVVLMVLVALSPLVPFARHLRGMKVH